MAGMTKIEPLGARVLILPIEGESQTAGGVLLPETAKEKTFTHGYGQP